MLTELKNRGVKDMLIACVDGLKGFPQAIEAVFPQAQVQLCIVHMVRASLNYVNWKERKQVAADLKPIYRAATAAEAEMNLEEFIAKWGSKYKAIGKLWRENWERVMPFFAFPEEVRKVIYTTNAVESLHRGPAENHQDARVVSERRGGAEAALPGAAKHQREMGHGAAMEGGLNQFEILWGDRIRAAQKE